MTGRAGAGFDQKKRRRRKKMIIMELFIKKECLRNIIRELFFLKNAGKFEMKNLINQSINQYNYPYKSTFLFNSINFFTES